MPADDARALEALGQIGHIEGHERERRLLRAAADARAAPAATRRAARLPGADGGSPRLRSHSDFSSSSTIDGVAIRMVCATSNSEALRLLREPDGLKSIEMRLGTAMLSLNAMSRRSTPCFCSSFDAPGLARSSSVSRCLRKAVASSNWYSLAPRTRIATIGIPFSTAVYSSSRQYGRHSTLRDWKSSRMSLSSTWSSSFVRSERSSESRKTGAPSIPSSSAWQCRASIAHSSL